MSTTEAELIELVAPDYPHQLEAPSAIVDLGPLLARGQTLTHEFSLTNPSTRPIRILRIEALTPCCSTIKERPDVIAPGGSGILRVEFRPGFQSGRKVVEFVICTDDPTLPSRRYGLAATLVGEVEIVVKDLDSTLPPGVAGRQTYRALCRQAKGEGRSLPRAIVAGTRTMARFTSEGRTVERDGVIESEREFVVDLLPDAISGTKRDAVRLEWRDGLDWTCPITWNVRSRVSATPAALIVRRSDLEPKKVLIHAEDQPFRVLKVGGNDWASCDLHLPTAEAKSHILAIRVDAAKWPEGSVRELTIECDHPDGRGIPISILVPPSSKGEEANP